MKLFYNYFAVLTIFVLCNFSLFGQQSNRKYIPSDITLWQEIPFDRLQEYEKVNRRNFPDKAFYYQLDVELLKQKLIDAPVRGTSSKLSPVIIEFPVSDGSFEKFRVKESPIMHPDLAAKFPMIKTYVAQGIDDPTATMRFSITQFGLHTMTLSGNRSTNYIDPYTTDLQYYIVYDKTALGSDAQSFDCLTDEGVALPSLENDISSTNRATNDSKLRKFRLAQSCTAEYGNIFDGTGTDAQKKANIQAQMTITINRVNTVYERDLATTLEFVANNDKIIYYGTTSADPWNGEYNSTTQTVIDNSTTGIGSSNYDIGHNFNTTDGGNAGCLGCVCVNGQKGSGMTGRSNPTGDAFDIDYVAHEMGHQFGGYHTMNNCSRSGNNVSEVEPGSGSSIMGYAGICSPNVQNQSDAHFNYVNIKSISANIKTGSSTCAVKTTIANLPPTADAGQNKVIPKSTAFILEGIGSDPDGNSSLTYNWSQNDPEDGGNGSPTSTRTLGPMYRSRMPVTVPFRYMPRVADILSGSLTPTWEVTPSVGRSMEFAFMVRDNSAEGGQTADDLMTVTVDGTTGPFVVTSQGTTTNWTTGSVQTITWNVAGTTGGSVNCANVDILLFLDATLTNPITIVSGVPNDGSQDVTIPGGSATNLGRIMVRGSNNIFFDINNSYIKITESEFTMAFSSTEESVCPGTTTVTYNFSYNTSSFSETTTFSALNVPAGASATFSPTTANSNGTNVQLTLSGLGSVATGAYTITVQGVATSVTKTQDVILNILAGASGIATLAQPANNSNGVINPVSFSWSDVGSGTLYDIDIATDVAFTNIVEQAIGISINSYTSGNLGVGTTHYWRINSYNDCVAGGYSSVFSFRTASCTSIDYSLTTDCYGHETYWEIQDATNGNVVLFSGGDPLVLPGGQGNITQVSNESLSNETTYNENYCLQDGCYDLVIYDDYNDGLNGSTEPDCSSDGDYSIVSGGSTLVQMTNVNFGSSVAHNFCLESCAIVISETATDATCNGNSDGSITVVADGGTTPYAYLWGNASTGTSITNLVAGTYSITVGDGEGCTEIKNIVIIEPNLINLSLSSTSPSCIGDNDGSINTSVSGGNSGSFNFVWSNGSTLQNPSGLIAMDYYCTVTDSKGCISNNSTTINEPSAITVSTSSTDQLCGSASGTASAVASGGAGNYSFIWDDSQVVNLATGLISGTYSVTVTDNNGCIAINSANVTASNPILTVNITTTDELCGSPTGTATGIISDGTQPYLYLWSNNETTATISGLYNGAITITVTDNNGCSGNTTSTVNASSITITSAISSTDQYCGSLSGTASVSTINGTSPYSYLWSDTQTSSTITGLSNGTFDITITDSNNCVGTNSVVVSPNLLNLSMTFNVIDQICSAPNGELEVIPNNGTSPYSYLWSDTQTSSTITGLSNGTFDITITDSNNCSGTNSISVSASVINLSMTFNVTDQICSAANGELQVIPTNGTSPYSYLWSDTQTTETVTGLVSNSYDVTLTDVNGCVGTNFGTVGNVIGAISLTTTSTSQICTGSNGSATIVVNSGNSPYSYLWENGQTTSSISGLNTGTYYLTVSDVNECKFEDYIVVDATNNSFSINTSTTDANCNQSNGSATVSVNSTTAQSYLWENGQTIETATGLSPGSYSIEITDVFGCYVVDYIQINNLNGPTVSLSKMDISCNGLMDGSIASTIIGDSPYTYTWSNNATTGSIDNLTANIYLCTVLDINGCSTVASAIISEPDVLSLSTSITDETTDSANDGTAMVDVFGGATPYAYNWSNNEVTGLISNLSPGNYSVTITDANSCEETASITITKGPTGIRENTELKIDIFPNPNNGNFNIVINEKGIFNLNIRNVLGQEVYSDRINGNNAYSIEGFSTGVYLISLGNSDVQLLKRIVVR